MDQLPILYKRTKNGAIQQWQIIVKGNTYYTIEGLLDGQKTTSLPTIVSGKNIGKSNETSDNEQSYKDAVAKHTKKLETGYALSINKIDSCRNYIEVMLAKNYDDYKDKIEFPVYSQPKLDGIRCIITHDSMRSRNGKDIVAAPHILESLQKFFEEFPDTILDGELYCDKFANDFNSIVSLVRQSKPITSDLVASKNSIQYWVYDIVDTTKDFFSRLVIYNTHLPQNNIIIKVPTLYHHDHDDLDRAFYKYIEDGYEGQIIRLNKPYENKRSKYLLKRKEFVDDEYIIEDIVEGEGGRTGTAGYMTFKTPEGKPFKSNIKGPHTFLKEVLKNKSQLVGKKATVKYFNLTPDGIPRFPYVISIDRFDQ